MNVNEDSSDGLMKRAHHEHYPNKGDRESVLKEKEMTSVIKFRNYVRSIIAMAILFTFVLAIAFGVINFLKLFLSFFPPLSIAITYTVMLGLSAILFSSFLQFLYVIGWIGSPEDRYTDKHKKLLVRAIVDYFEPGCVYDCRVVDNRRDVISLLVGILVTYFASLGLYWLGASQSKLPDDSTPAGVRYAVIQLSLLFLAIFQVYFILSGLWGYYMTAILVPEKIHPA